MRDPQDHLDLLVNQITRLGIDRSPNEAGGVIIPHEGPPSDWLVELANISLEPTDTCLFDMSRFQEDNYDRLCQVEDPGSVWLWHTHPGGNVGPSGMDLDHRIPGVRYLVVAIPSGLATRY